MRHYYVVMMPRPFNYALHLKCLLFDVLPCQWGTRMQWIINIGIDYYSKSQKVEFFYWLDITLAHYQFQSQTSVLCLTLHIGSWSCIEEGILMVHFSLWCWWIFSSDTAGCLGKDDFHTSEHMQIYEWHEILVSLGASLPQCGEKSIELHLHGIHNC